MPIWSLVHKDERIEDYPPSPAFVSASEQNRAFYNSLPPGAADYFRKMAAPRFRVQTLLSLIAERPTQEIADLGCGNGLLLAEIANRFPNLRLCGIDIAGSQLELNRQTVPTCHFVEMDLASAAPAAVPAILEGRFDTITAAEIIEHIDDPVSFLRNTRALCRPGGRLLLSTQSGPIHETERRVGHRRHYSAEQMQELLTCTGFTPLRVWNSGYPFHDLSKWYANRNPDAAMRQFSGRRYGIREELICLGLRLLFHWNSQSRGAQLFAIAERSS